MNRRLTVLLPALGALVVVAVGVGAITAKRADSAGSPPTTASEDMSAIQADIDAIAETDLQTSLSSNPFDYAAHSPALQRLVAKGTPALPVIEARIRESSANGLAEYLLVVAAQQITKIDVAGGPNDSPLREVDVAKQWPDAWRSYRKAVRGWTRKILASGMTNAEKNRALTALGTPALPDIVDEVAAGHDELSPAADALVQGCVEVGGAADVHVTPEWARAHGSSFAMLRSLTE